MNTPEITEAQIVEYMRARVAAIDTTGVESFTVWVAGRKTTVEPFYASGYRPGQEFVGATGSTFAEAVAGFFKDCPTGKALAEQKRQAARKLVAEADAISPPAFAAPRR